MNIVWNDDQETGVSTGFDLGIGKITLRQVDGVWRHENEHSGTNVFSRCDRETAKRRSVSLMEKVADAMRHRAASDAGALPKSAEDCGGVCVKPPSMGEATEMAIENQQAFGRAWRLKRPEFHVADDLPITATFLNDLGIPQGRDMVHGFHLSVECPARVGVVGVGVNLNEPQAVYLSAKIEAFSEHFTQLPNVRRRSDFVALCRMVGVPLPGERGHRPFYEYDNETKAGS